jgi:hypothetical protein
VWNEDEAKKITWPPWRATARRAENERPSRMFSTSNTIGRSVRPGRMK